VLLPDTDELGSLHAAHRILQRIEEMAAEHLDSPFGHVTLSIGSVTWGPKYFAEETLLVHQADRSLYESKKIGAEPGEHPNGGGTGRAGAGAIGLGGRIVGGVRSDPLEQKLLDHVLDRVGDGAEEAVFDRKGGPVSVAGGVVGV
jgi:GGDEF domain-containing protein